jgi:hypothetical protein
MAKRVSKCLCTLWFVILIFSSLIAEGIKSPFNGLSLQLDEKPQQYTILLGGHLYGAYTHSEFPAASLLANIDKINASRAKFFISLGDNFRKCDKLQISNYKNAFASQLKIPMFNAVGNTDLSDRELYELEFGKNTYYAFIYNDDYFVFLDSELDNGSILGDQLAFFSETMRKASAQPSLNNVLIFSHRWLWAVKSEYKAVYEISGLSYANYTNTNFLTRIEPALIELAKKKPIYWFSGENGPGGSLPLFYAKDPSHNITYIAVGLGDTEKDILLECRFERSSPIRFTPISLTGHEVKALETYGLNYWKSYYHSNNTFFDKYTGKVRRMLQSIYFWTGIFVMLPFTALVLFLLRRH